MSTIKKVHELHEQISTKKKSLFERYTCRASKVENSFIRLGSAFERIEKYCEMTAADKELCTKAILQNFDAKLIGEAFGSPVLSKFCTVTHVKNPRVTKTISFDDVSDSDILSEEVVIMKNIQNQVNKLSSDYNGKFSV